MCIDYSGLNKHCPKDPFPLPRIDQVIDLTARAELLCFLDAYSGYHQIRMKESDQTATSFVTPFRNLLLRYYALWFEKCRCDVPANDADVFEGSDRSELPCLS